jgi:EamA-like transporter family.
MLPSGKARAYIEIIFVNIMWGLSFIGSKKAMGAGLQPFSLVMLRFLVSSVVLFPIAVLSGTKLRISLKDIPGLILSALFGVTIYFFFELNG